MKLKYLLLSSLTFLVLIAISFQNSVAVFKNDGPLHINGEPDSTYLRPGETITISWSITVDESHSASDISWSVSGPGVSQQGTGHSFSCTARAPNQEGETNSYVGSASYKDYDVADSCGVTATNDEDLLDNFEIPGFEVFKTLLSMFICLGVIVIVGHKRKFIQ
ncbi:MAG: hypothetical protein ACFFCV_11040 [Promethearchaeota archaeon]